MTLEEARDLLAGDSAPQVTVWDEEASKYRDAVLKSVLEDEVSVLVEVDGTVSTVDLVNVHAGTREEVDASFEGTDAPDGIDDALIEEQDELEREARELGIDPTEGELDDLD